MRQPRKPNASSKQWVRAQDIYVLALTDPSVDSSDEEAIVEYVTEKCDELWLDASMIIDCVRFMHPFDPALQQSQRLIDRWIDELYEDENPPIEELQQFNHQTNEQTE